MDRRVVILHFWMKQVDDKWGRRMLVIQRELMDARMDEEEEREGRKEDGCGMVMMIDGLT